MNTNCYMKKFITLRNLTELVFGNKVVADSVITIYIN